MKLFYIGDAFYQKSGTMMGPIYHDEPRPPEGGYYRSDWGKVSIALRDGEEVHIRQATADELRWAIKTLGECRS